MKNKYRNTENIRAVLSVVIRAVLGMITASALLMWMTGTAPDLPIVSLENVLYYFLFILNSFTYFIYAETESVVAVIVTTGVFRLFLGKEMRELSWYKPLLLNICLCLGTGISFSLFPFLFYPVIFLLLLLASVLPWRLFGIVILALIYLIVIAANKILYKECYTLPEEKRHGTWITILLCLANSFVLFIDSCGIPALLFDDFF